MFTIFGLIISLSIFGSIIFIARKNKYYENLKLALQWNRDDIAKSDIFTGEEEFKTHQLANLMEMALLQNKPKFVELLLENGLNLKSFLTVRRLYFLYNSYKVLENIYGKIKYMSVSKHELKIFIFTL